MDPQQDKTQQEAGESRTGASECTCEVPWLSRDGKTLTISRPECPVHKGGWRDSDSEEPQTGASTCTCPKPLRGVVKVSCPIHGELLKEPQRHHFPPLEGDWTKLPPGQDTESFPSDFDRIQALVYVGITTMIELQFASVGMDPTPSAERGFQAMRQTITAGARVLADEMLSFSKAQPQEEERDADTEGA